MQKMQQADGFCVPHDFIETHLLELNEACVKVYLYAKHAAEKNSGAVSCEVLYAAFGERTYVQEALRVLVRRGCLCVDKNSVVTFPVAVQTERPQYSNAEITQSMDRDVQLQMLMQAAEQVLGSVPTLKRALENLRNREQRLIEQGKPREPGAIDYSKPFTDSHFVSDTLNELLELSECSKNIAETQRKLAELENIIDQLNEEYKKVVVLWYVEKRSKEAIMEELYIESLTTVYNLRNRAVAEFALLYYGASAMPSI